MRVPEREPSMKWKLIVNPKPLKARSSKSQSIPDTLPVCTLILSNVLYKRFRKNWKGTRSGARCLNELLSLYASELEKRKTFNPDPLILKYQRKKTRIGNEWSRLNFRPSASDWGRLGLLARKHGVSRCYLFSYLLDRYFSGESEPKSASKKVA